MNRDIPVNTDIHIGRDIRTNRDTTKTLGGVKMAEKLPRCCGPSKALEKVVNSLNPLNFKIINMSLF